MTEQIEAADPAAATGAEMTLMAHLRELRYRLILCLISICVGAAAAFPLSELCFKIINSPYYAAFPGQLLIGTGPAEALILRIKVTFLGGLVLALPVIFFQLWRFISPGLQPNERRLLIPFIGASSALFLAGMWFCYSLILPVAFSFFADQYRIMGLTPAVRIGEHLNMVLTSLLAFGVIFEMPVLAFFLGRIGVIDHRLLIEWSRYAIVLIFAAAAVLTPPDIVSQLLMAAPLLVLYGLSILLVKHTAVKSNRRDSDFSS